uniref:Guanylate kinase/L-type calcium channel beta subunit domain-containing protein n=1 Tax=Suricata suricatta TaxID=37032 RepID=A0A673V6K9_SURSU
MRGKTVEEVYVEMLKPKEDVRLKVQNRPEEFTKVKGLPGDSFYIRALYDRLAEVEHELSFKKDVTSSTLMTLCLRAHLGPGWPGSLTRTPRRSSEGRSPANTYSMSLAYQRVQKVDCTSLRPVPILGPLLDVVKEMLVNKTPGKFCRCPFEVMKASQQAIERGVKDCLLVDYKRRSGHFDVTTVASIREIAEKGRSGPWDVFPSQPLKDTHCPSPVKLHVFICSVWQRGRPGRSPVEHLHSDLGDGPSRTKQSPVDPSLPAVEQCHAGSR